MASNKLVLFQDYMSPYLSVVSVSLDFLIRLVSVSSELDEAKTKHSEHAILSIY